ncbi:hypothetical protein SUGI_0389950 [Cryptomeria japonica]|nr:hypothetical protein SUGI_0389950 [Cryptomeria japonica]
MPKSPLKVGFFWLPFGWRPLLRRSLLVQGFSMDFKTMKTGGSDIKVWYVLVQVVLCAEFGTSEEFFTTKGFGSSVVDDLIEVILRAEMLVKTFFSLRSVLVRGFRFELHSTVGAPYVELDCCFMMAIGPMGAIIVVGMTPLGLDLVFFGVSWWFPTLSRIGSLF